MRQLHPRFRAVLGAVGLVAGLVNGGLRAAEAAPAPNTPPDWDTAAGHFYSQANGLASGHGNQGFVSSDEGGMAFWSEYRRLGGSEVLGYPASHRFMLDGRVAQLTQKSLLVWVPEDGRARTINVFDRFPELLQTPMMSIGQRLPAPMDPPGDPGPTTEAAARNRLKLMDVNPAIKSLYFSLPDPLSTYGVPQSSVRDYGDSYVVLLQKAIIQQWKKAVPWAAAGEVRVLNVGDVLKGMGVVPGQAISPSLGPEPARPAPGASVQVAAISLPAAASAQRASSPSPPSPVSTVPEGSDWMNVYVTGYTIRGSMANGNQTHPGAMAAFWRQFPVGSRVELAGLGMFTVEDTGPAIGPNRLDIWVPSTDQAYGVTGWYKARRLS